jgi:Transposase DDE domain group 1
VGRPPNKVRRSYASFSYRAGSWTKPRRVVAKVEWHPGELHPRVGFIVTNMARPAENVVAFYNKRGRASSGSKRERARQNGPDCHVARSPPTPRVSIFMHWLTISAISCARWRRQIDQGLVADDRGYVKTGRIG